MCAFLLLIKVNLGLSYCFLLSAALVNYGHMDGFIGARMLLSGIPLDEPFLRFHLSILMKEEKKHLCGGRIKISDSYYLMGTADPTGKLKSDEVCIILYAFFMMIFFPHLFLTMTMHCEFNGNLVYIISKVCSFLFANSCACIIYVLLTSTFRTELLDNLSCW